MKFYNGKDLNIIIQYLKTIAYTLSQYYLKHIVVHNINSSFNGVYIKTKYKLLKINY